HFVNAKDAKLFPPYNNEISTVDHTLFLAGAMPAASYFGGDVAKQVDAIAAATNWRAFQVGDEGMISFAWKPTDNSDVSGTGAYMDLTWKLASDEERLVYFLATGCPTEQFAVEPQKYYHLLRRTGQLNDMPPFVVSWNGALFTYFFSHCYINYRAFDADDPAQFGESGPRVDWFENSRRATLAHRQRCIEYADKFSTFATDRWGLSPCMGKIGSNAHWDYLVQDLLPNWSGREETFRGTIAPYAAGSSIMFTPSESMTALHAFRNLKGDDGKPLAWREPTEGGYAFVDSFNVETQVASDDNIAIDVGPMLLAIENARTGLIWKLFMQHADAQRAVARLRLAPLR
ncbi:MAG: hypothetical protein KDA61_15770, partial [Planctomycetales bacterium]|nr:hypothetical protein [Planctomycetales bacterium]